MGESLGHGDKLPRRAGAVIAALLSEGSIKAAAAKAGVSESTVRAWLRDRPGFAADYRAARRQAVEAATGALQAADAEAAETLRRELTGKRSSGRIKAAVAILDRAIKGVELMDLAERVAELERAAKARGDR
jgi:transposase